MPLPPVLKKFKFLYLILSVICYQEAGQPAFFNYNQTMKGNITPEQQLAARTHMGAWLKERREEIGLSQSELARQIGIDQATINKIEAGKWAISVDMIELFLLYYGCSIADIFVLTTINK